MLHISGDQALCFCSSILCLYSLLGSCALAGDFKSLSNTLPKLSIEAQQRSNMELGFQFDLENGASSTVGKEVEHCTTEVFTANLNCVLCEKAKKCVIPF